MSSLPRWREVFKEGQRLIVRGGSHFRPTELAGFGNSSLGPVVDSDGGIVDDPIAHSSQGQAQHQLRIVLGHPAEEALIKADSAQEISAHA